MSGARPLTRQRSPWKRSDNLSLGPGIVAAYFTRNVSDGLLRALVAEEPAGWHLSISFVNHAGRPSRYPRWDEILHARDELLPGEVGFVMHLPPEGEYVAVHDTTVHLHEHPERGGYVQVDVWDRAPSDPDRVTVYYQDEPRPADAVPLFRRVP